MCRLLASMSPTAHSLDSVGDDQLHQFQALTQLHGDGWGVAWRDTSGAVQRYRSAHRALDDPYFVEYSSEIASDAHLVHTRLASPGFRVLEANAHPFFAEGVAFAHNGTIGNSENLEAHFPATDLNGDGLDTDSKRYFALVLERAKRTGSLESGLAEAISIIRETCGVAGLNAMVLSRDEFLCAHAWQGAKVSRNMLVDRVGGAEYVPPGHDERYYLLSTRRVGDVFQIASTGLVGGAWEPLPEEGIVAVDRSSAQARFTALGASESSAL